MRKNWRTKTTHRAISDINMTNLIDVTMTVLICYILITPIIEQGIDVKLPQTSPSRLEEVKNINVTVSKDNKIYIGNSLVNLSQLKDRLQAAVKESPDTGVVIKADQDINYGMVINVLDELNAAGISNVGLATEVKK